MKTWIKILLSLGCSAIVAFLAYQYGQLEGFGSGYAYQKFHSSTSEAYHDTIVLTLIREGKIDKATNLMELHLDGEIVAHGLGLVNKPEAPPPLTFLDDLHTSNKLMVRVSKYRKEHLSTTTDSEVKRNINSVIARYSKE